MGRDLHRLEALALALTTLCACGTTADARRQTVDAGYSDADAKELQLEDRFWEKIALCGTPAEEYPDIFQAADEADAVVVARFSNVSAGRSFQTDAAELFYAEANVTMDIEETLRGQAKAAPVVSFVIAESTAESLDGIVATMRENLPQQKLVALLQERGDIKEMPELYRLHAAFMGLWTRTTRSRLDNPVVNSSCLDHYGPEVRSHYLKGADTLEELITSLRD